MPKYKGKRANVTFPVEIYERLVELAAKEMRTVSQMVVVLVQEGLDKRETQKQTPSPSPDKEDKEEK